MEASGRREEVEGELRGEMEEVMQGMEIFYGDRRADKRQLFASDLHILSVTTALQKTSDLCRGQQASRRFLVDSGASVMTCKQFGRHNPVGVPLTSFTNTTCLTLCRPVAKTRLVGRGHRPTDTTGSWSLTIVTPLPLALVCISACLSAAICCGPFPRWFEW